MSCSLRLAAGAALLLSLAAAVVAAAGAALPSDLPAVQRARLEAIAEAAAVSTRVQADPFPARPEIFEFLLDHPEFATRVTRVLKLARYRIWREPDGLHLDDGWGTVGRFDVVYAANGTRIMHARGVYRKRLFPAIHGEAVVMIEYTVRRGPDGTTLIVPTVTGFVKFDSRLVTAATNVVAPVARAKADREARKLVKVFAKVSRAAEEQPAALVRDLAREPDVSPRDLAGFRKLLDLP